MKFLRLIMVFAVFFSSGCLFAEHENLKGNTVFTAIKKILAEPQTFKGAYVSIKAVFQGWGHAPGKPPVTRSDWVAVDPDGSAIYCTGLFPDNLMPDDPSAFGRKITVLGKVELDSDGRPYVKAGEVLPIQQEIEVMVSVSQILFDFISMKGRTVGLLGVLAKGYGSRGNRIYLLADPTGAITLDKLPKLYPKGTILRIKGVIGSDANGLPQLTNVEIISAQL